MTRHLTRAVLALALALTTIGGSALAHAQHLADGKVLGLCRPGQAAKIAAQAPFFFDLPPDFLPKDV
jgi:hypothetical protein